MAMVTDTVTVTVMWDSYRYGNGYRYCDGYGNVGQLPLWQWLTGYLWRFPARVFSYKSYLQYEVLLQEVSFPAAIGVFCKTCLIEVGFCKRLEMSPEKVFLHE
jgi:hypothetical protein